ncbi:MAG: hypothetical protein IJB60_02425 [Bacteroidaceae bacterium]|nr:hypothetical protein [Bacteroidaceae bacterium]
MGVFLLSALCAMFFNTHNEEIRKDTIDRYVIDKQIVENFDGTQLEGKTISKYIIAYKDAGNVVERKHVIFTHKNSVTIGNVAINSTTNGNYLDGNSLVSGDVFSGIFIVDGKETSVHELVNVANDIEHINVFKPGSDVAKSYGEKGNNGVIVVTTKTNKNGGHICFVDGRRVEKSEVDKLSSDKIESMTVKKEEGASVIYIVTKKK